MSKRERIHAALNVLNPQYLELLDESHTHANSHKSHYKVTVVSAAFVGLNSRQRHQCVYTALGNLMTQIHALAIHTYTLEEWGCLQAAPSSPVCAGVRS